MENGRPEIKEADIQVKPAISKDGKTALVLIFINEKNIFAMNSQQAYAFVGAVLKSIEMASSDVDVREFAKTKLQMDDEHAQRFLAAYQKSRNTPLQ